MADELVEIIEKFDLNSKEKGGIEVEAEEMAVGITECKLCLPGKVVEERIANFNGIRNFVSSVWGCSKKLKVTELGANMFQFIFYTNLEIDRVLNGGPWLIDNQILVLERWT